MSVLSEVDVFMSTDVEQHIVGDNAESVYSEVKEKIQNLEELLSFFKSSSEVTKINQMAGKAKVVVSDETMQILLEAQKIQQLSKGAFAITSAPIIRLWRDCGKEGRLPKCNEISQAIALSGGDVLQLNKEESSAYLKMEGCLIDLGGIAKGYAADACIQHYKDLGIRTAYINFGGNVKAINDVDTPCWNIGLQDPDETRGVSFGALSIENESVVTSGGYERFIEIDGTRYHHLINPKTGKPSQTGLKSVSVICENSMLADALSTAVFVLGLSQGIDLIQRIPETKIVIMDSENRVYVSKSLKNQFHILDQGKAHMYYTIEGKEHIQPWN